MTCTLKAARAGIVFTLLFVATLSCFASSVSDRIAAVVNDDVILESEIRKYKLPFIRDIISQLPLGIVPPGKWPTEKEILEELIVIHLLEQEAAKRGLKIDDRGVDATLESIKKRNNLTQDQFVLYLNTKGINYAEYRKLMKRQFVLTKLIASEVTQKIPFAEEDVIQYYKKNKAKIDDEYGKLVEKISPAQQAKEPEKMEIPTNETIYVGGKIRLKQIILKIPGRSPKDVERTMERARSIFKDVVYNGADFSELAKRNSNDPTASKGGDLGSMNYNDMVPQMQKLVQRMKEGDVTPPLKTPEAVLLFHLAEARNRTEKKVPIPEKIRKEMEKQVKEDYDRRMAQYKRAQESAKSAEDHEEDGEKPKIPPGMLTPEEEKDYLKIRRKALNVVRNEKGQTRMRDWIGDLKKNSIIEVKI